MSEFAHRLNLQQIRDGERIDLSADEGERAAIAARLRLPTLARFDAHVVLLREGERVVADGRIKAQLEQSCIATGDPVPASVDEAFKLLFVPEPAADPDSEIELSEQDCDVVFHDGQSVDLGTALADTLALALDPYPRSPAADEALREAGVLSEEQAGPFAALAALKGKMD